MVVVNPMKVKRSKKLDDDSPMKNDTNNAKVIAEVIRDGRYHEPTLPVDVYDSGEYISIKAQIHNALDRYFPEFLNLFKDWTGKAALHLLESGYLPKDIRKTSEDDLLSDVKQVAKRGVGIKRIQALKQALKTVSALQWDYVWHVRKFVI
ncbi:Transposase [Lentibacillus halodurans]|uniref:Transposase n=1 Tax=Lentibacillus halodurans TaxID=237679 RepID=A0A1I0XH52_9BACI|nr:Transposase [Lentibacillus halodurans]